MLFIGRAARYWLVLSLLCGVPVRAQAGQHDIAIGMTAAFSGPLKELGRSMRSGIEAHFAEINRKGGVGGRKLRLIALDDSYHPPTAADNMLRLIHDHKVIAIVGSVGTPTATRTLPISVKERVLFFGALSGAALLRPDPPERYIINFRASYGDETRTMIDGLVANGVKPQEIAFFTQDDAYGEDGYNASVAALEAHGFAAARDLPRGRYQRSTLDVEQGLAVLLDAPRPPKAIIMVAAYAPAAKFIRLARQIFPQTLFLNVSFVGSEALRQALGPDGENVIVTEVAPLLDSGLPAVSAFHAAMAALAPQAAPNIMALEGYLAARVFVRGLQAAGGDINRESVIDGLLSLGDFDIGLDSRLSLGPGDHQASDVVWPTVIRGGRFLPLDWRRIEDLYVWPVIPEAGHSLKALARVSASGATRYSSTVNSPALMMTSAGMPGSRT